MPEILNPRVKKVYLSLGKFIWGKNEMELNLGELIQKPPFELDNKAVY
jgi:hypothetical protein